MIKRKRNENIINTIRWRNSKKIHLTRFFWSDYTILAFFLTAFVFDMKALQQRAEIRPWNTLWDYIFLFWEWNKTFESIPVINFQKANENLLIKDKNIQKERKEKEKKCKMNSTSQKKSDFAIWFSLLQHRKVKQI